MSEAIEEKIRKIPLVRNVVRGLKRVHLLEELSLYDLLEIYIAGIGKAALGNRAGSIAFSFFMSLFPFALFILNLIPFIPIEGFQQDFMKFVADSVPPNTFDAVHSIINDILHNSYKGLLSSGFLLSIFLQANGLNAILTGFENSSKVRHKRAFFHQYIVALGMSFCLILILLATIAIIVTFEVFLQDIKIQNVLSDNIPILIICRYIFVILMILMGTSILFKFGTIRTEKRPFISVGSVFTTILIIITSYGFGIWVIRFSKYNQLYGSIGTLLIMMFYIWINSMILLLGFELETTIREHKESLKRKKQVDS